MQKQNFVYVVEAAQDARYDHPLALALRAATAIVPADPISGESRRVTVDAQKFKQELIARGLAVVDDKQATTDHGFRPLENLVRVLVQQDGNLIAMGAASNEHEAILHAALGWFREHPLPGSEVPEGVAKLPGII
jgi:hypothetical protein